MGHTERIIVELASLDEAEQARLLLFVEALKVEREVRAALAAALAPYRVALGSYRFDREEANAR